MRASIPLVVGCALWVSACQQREGACPRIDEVSPSQASRAEVVAVRGADFALGHADLFGDGSAVVPTARLVVDPEVIALFAPEMAEQEIELSVEAVAFVSSSELAVTMPDIDWDDMTSGLSMMGVDIPEPPPLPLLPLPVVLSVTNPAGCEGSFEGDLVFNLEVPQEEGE